MVWLDWFVRFDCVLLYVAWVPVCVVFLLGGCVNSVVFLSFFCFMLKCFWFAA